MYMYGCPSFCQTFPKNILLKVALLESLFKLIPIFDI